MSKIEYYKNKISLIDYIQYKELPFTISDKSSRNQLKIYHETTNEYGDLVRGDTLIISRFKKEGKIYDNYFNAIDDWKNKTLTIIDFVHNYVFDKKPTDKVDFAAVFQELDDYINSPHYVNPEDSVITLKTHTGNGNNSTAVITDDIKKNIKAPTKEMFDYLKSRRLNTNIYISDIFTSTYAIYTYQKGSFIKDNPAFLYLNEKNKIKTIQQIVEFQGEKGLVRQKYFLKNVDKGNALWKSNKLNDINLVILTEAPEKCMAHYQIYHKDMEKNNIIPYYLATGGNVNDNQLEHIYNILKEYNKELILSYDNDLPGQFYTVKTLLYFNSPYIELNKSLINNIEHYHIALIREDNIDFQKDTKSETYYYNHQHKNFIKFHSQLITLSETAPNIKTSFNTNNDLIFTIEATPKNISFIKKSLKENLLKNNNIKIMEQQAITKDWVDDLERIDTLKIKKYEKKDLNL